MKKCINIFFIILSFVSVSLIGWYSYVLLFAPNKVVSQTYKIGDQVVFKSDGMTDTKTFIDLNVYDNVFEIKFNYMLDETKTSFYSQGLQYVLKDGKSDFDLSGTYTRVLSDVSHEEANSYFEFGKSEYSGYMCWMQTDTLNQVWGDKDYKNVDKFNYMSGDDYDTTLISTHPIDNDTFFKIQLGDKLFGMKFKGKDIDLKDEFFIGSRKYHVDSESYLLWSKFFYLQEYNYMASDIDYFSTILFNAVSSISAGTNQIVTFEFGDLFDYYEYDASKGQYSEEKVSVDIAGKISADIKSFYSIRINKHDGNMLSSVQSLFNCYKGNSNYNVDLSLNDYFVGRTLVSVDVDKFDFIESKTSGMYYLSLNKDFASYYAENKHLVQLEIIIDLDYLNELGITYLGVVRDSLDGFVIYDAYTINIDFNSSSGTKIRGDIFYV